MLRRELYTSESMCSWDQLVDYDTYLPKANGRQKKWIFRGQKSYDKNSFQTSLERAAESFDIAQSDWPKCEARLLREFKRKAHHYLDIQQIPKEQDNLAWLALMQHHGAPTRLLDWTYSFFVALYFAVEQADERGYEVWALNADYFSLTSLISKHDRVGLQKRTAEMRKEGLEQQHQDREIMKQNTIIDYLWKYPVLSVHSVNPYKLNERLVIQQGVFLFPGDISQSFEDNLSAPGYSGKSQDNLIRFKIDKAIRPEVLENLNRINMTRATLFPGLDGFAESLRTRLSLLMNWRHVTL